MKKLTLLMLFAFLSTAFVHATEFDDKIEEYKNIYTQFINNKYSNAPDKELHETLVQESNILYKEISNEIEAIQKSTFSSIENMKNNHMIFSSMYEKEQELKIWIKEKEEEAQRKKNQPILDEIEKHLSKEEYDMFVSYCKQ